MSSIQSDIQDLVLGFFDAIGSGMSSEDDGVYRITVPEKYRSLFSTHEICIAFDKATASKHGCELVISGSRILSIIIDVCTNKGPVALRKPRVGNSSAKIRYHFFITFSGRSSVMMMDYADVDLNTVVPSETIDQPMGNSPLGWIEPSKITSTYTAALKEMKKRHGDTKATFLDDANDKFLNELEMFVNKHNSHVRELDHAINYKEHKSGDRVKSQEFRFRMADRIEDLEKEKRHLTDTLQQKHRVVLEYRLVACEVVAG